MKVALAILPQVKLNKILASFVLNMPFIKFLSFISFGLVFYFIYLLSFLLKCFIVLKDSISLVLTLKITTLCGFTCFRDQGISAI